MKILSTIALVTIASLSPACSSSMQPADSPENAPADTADSEAEAETETAGDIVDVASGAGQFETLVAAVQAAGLVDTLKSEGPFTVFAPTDEAFAKLPEGTVEDLLKPENKDKLVAILTYHVVPGKVLANDVVSMDSAETVQGGMLKITAGDEGVMVNEAKVIKTDIETSNGVIHVIDTVVIPG